MLGTTPVSSSVTAPPAAFESLARVESLLSEPAISACETSIERRSGLSYREFVYEYQRKRRPVILTDATAN
jgi:hypothetical protein